MAISEDTLPAPAGKENDAHRLIFDTLNTLASVEAGLKRLQNWPNTAQLNAEILLLQGVADGAIDAYSCLKAVLEDLVELQ